MAAGPLEAVILPEAGARLHRLRAFGQDLLRTPADPATHLTDPFFWGAYVLAPWANRIEAAPTKVAGRTARPVANFDDGSAIHGLVHDRPWQRDRDELRIHAGGGDSWPWRYEVDLDAGAVGDRLRLNYRLTNRSDTPMPAGLGLHPWFRKPLEVAIPAESVFRTTTASPALPEPVHGEFDRRVLGPLAPDLDCAWTDLDGPHLDLRWPAIGIGLRMDVEAPGLHVVAASPSTLDAVAVEVQTHAPQGMRRLLRGEPGALSMLKPGRSLELAITLSGM